jgi:predicted nucleic acid-binding protein
LNGFLLDTNTLSALRKPAENRALVEFIRVQPRDYLHTSTVTLAEIRLGIELKQDPTQRADLLTWLDHRLRPLFEDRVQAVGEDVLLRWLLINRDGRAQGHVYSQQDSLIAAVAAMQQLVVVTRDVTHFVEARVPTLDPWKGQFHCADGRSHRVKNLVSATLLAELPG